MTFLSSPAENMYVVRGEMAMPRIALMWPVRVRRRPPSAPAAHFARSQTLMVRSAAPVTNHSLFGSKAQHRTQPRWPETTDCSFQGACHVGSGTFAGARRRGTMRRLEPSTFMPVAAMVGFCAWPVVATSAPDFWSYATTLRLAASESSSGFFATSFARFRFLPPVKASSSSSTNLRRSSTVLAPVVAVPAAGRSAEKPPCSLDAILARSAELTGGGGAKASSPPKKWCVPVDDRSTSSRTFWSSPQCVVIAGGAAGAAPALPAFCARTRAMPPRRAPSRGRVLLPRTTLAEAPARP
mmetsp:Transcript_73/g.274  ORF Transcript_73/g.274 Transcript_73/m.274 type:complete len:297 (-) Transcript_73:12-902(-)